MKKKIYAFIFFIILNSTFLIHNCEAQWVQMSNGIVYNKGINTFVASGSTIFAGTESDGVYKSTNNGLNWIQTSLNNKQINSLTANGSTIFAGTEFDGVYKSTNNGTIWTTQYNVWINHPWIKSLITNGNTIFAATYQDVFVSYDNGESWTEVYIVSQQLVNSLTLNGNIVFAGTMYNGVYVSFTNGATWFQTSLNNKCIWSLATNGNKLFAGSYDGSVYTTTNNGTTWLQTSINNYSVRALATSNNYVFAGTFSNGVYVSNNNGSNWIQKNEGLGVDLYINSLYIFNNFIYAGNLNVFRRPLAELIGIKQISELVPKSFSLYQNYPNPFNPSTKIRFSLPHPSQEEEQEVKLIFYDALGRELTTLINEQLQPGTYEAEFNGASYPSGVYFYKIISGNNTETKKMILVK